jgi:hypothetical protein
LSDQLAQFYQVVEYIPALQSVQGMEARDFQYKGIFKLFTCISEWTDKFLTNKALPNVEHLSKETGIEKERIELYINELALKSNVPFVKKITVVEFDHSNSEKTDMISNILKRNTVFARPPTLDSTSSQRYVNYSNESSVSAIKNAISKNRVRLEGEKFKEYLFSKISNNKLSDTYASADISNLFNCSYDINKHLKEATVNTQLKPILKKLVDDRVLLFFRNEKAGKSSNKSIFLYNDNDEIAERISIYLEYIKQNMIPKFQKLSVVGDISEEDMNDPIIISSLLINYVDNSFGDQKVILEELMILGKFYDDYKEEKRKAELKEKLQEVIKVIQGAGKLVDLASIKIDGESLDKDFIRQILSNDNILFAEYDDSKNFFEFVLHKSNIKTAVLNAKQLFEITENDSELNILRRMDLGKYLDSETSKELQAAEYLSLFRFLPFFVRFWRMLTGNIYVTQKEADAIRIKKDNELKKRIENSKLKQLEREKQKIVSERMKKNNEEEKFQPSSKESNQIKETISAEEEKKLKEVFKSISSILDSAWDQKLFPDREYLLSRLEGIMTEDEMINHLKKNFSKDVFSFQIKSKNEDNPKFKWPILITRNYLKRNGKKLLDLAKKNSDIERNEAAPDQEKFDLYSSLEDFLERNLNKI